jgi:hypothetical protein
LEYLTTPNIEVSHDRLNSSSLATEQERAPAPFNLLFFCRRFLIPRNHKRKEAKEKDFKDVGRWIFRHTKSEPPADKSTRRERFFFTRNGSVPITCAWGGLPSPPGSLYDYHQGEVEATGMRSTSHRLPFTLEPAGKEINYQPIQKDYF